METSGFPRKRGSTGFGISNEMGRLPGSQYNPCPVRTQNQGKQFTNVCLAHRRLHAQIGRRFLGIPRHPFPMTIELQGPRAKISGNMDNFVPSPEFYRDGDHTLPGSDIAAYAASPNSLYMYEQEKHDMQNTINGALCNPSTTFTTVKEDFDLKPQYELNSLDLSLAESYISSANQTNPNQWIKTENIFDSDMSSDAIFPMDSSNMSTEPTLAALNMEESLIDEVVSLVNADSAYATSTGSVLCSKGDNSRSLSALSSVQSNGLSNGVTDLKGMLSKHPAQSTSHAASSTMPSGLSSWNLCNSQAKVPSSTNVSPSVQSTVPMSSASSTNFQNVAKPLVNFHRDEKPTLHKLLLKKSMMPQVQQTSNGTVATPGMKRTASAAKLEAVEEKWKEIEKYIHEPTEENKSTTSSSSKRSRHESENSTLPSQDDPESENDVFSDRDSDLDDDLSDEEGTLSQLSPFEEGVSGKRKEKQYFWQYNVQSKGPKGTRLRLELDRSNPHELKHFEDPVFDPTNTQVAGIRHGGKARKGDGNDVHPNPKRLVQIGMQIKRLNRKINEVTSLGESTASARNQSRKEKNKLASRACRLKKKAQHEANKVKLFGLEKEHKQLMDVMVSIRASLKKHLLEQGETRKESLVDKLEELIKTYLKEMIAGHTTDYVNKVIANYEKGDPTGGLDIKRK